MKLGSPGSAQSFPAAGVNRPVPRTWVVHMPLPPPRRMSVSGSRKLRGRGLPSRLYARGGGSDQVAGPGYLFVAGHSQAAPRTPLESPYLAFTMGVVTLSEKTYLGKRSGTSR